MLDDLIQEAQAIAKSHAFIRAIADLDRTDNALRLRLVIDETMFIQVYANSKKGKLNFALISLGQRIFGGQRRRDMAQASLRISRKP